MLTERDEEILLALTTRVRMFSLVQAARHWWQPGETGERNARKRFQMLVDDGLVQRLCVYAHPELELAEPICSWRPGEPQPCFGPIAYRLQSRWEEAIRPLTIFTATREAAKRFAGSGGVLKHPHQVTHDLHVAALYLRILRSDPARAARWISEEKLAPARRHQKLPDAIIRGVDGGRDLVIEFGGAYRAERVKRVHDDCAKRGLSYELW